MTMPAYSISEYSFLLKMGKLPVLLVEGKDNKRAFDRLLTEANAYGYSAPKRISIDTGDILKSEDGKAMGNCEKIEELFNRIGNKNGFEHVVGFMDRISRFRLWE